MEDITAPHQLISILVKHIKKDKVTISFVPIDLIYAGQLTSKQEVLNHLCEKHGLIEPELLLGRQKN